MKDISKKVIETQKRMQDIYDKLRKYKEEHSIKKFKAKFIKCPKCGSQIRIDLLENKRLPQRKGHLPQTKLEYICPVCKTDMRAEYIVKKIFEYETKLKIEMVKLYELFVKNGYDSDDKVKTIKGIKYLTHSAGYGYRYDIAMVVRHNDYSKSIGTVKKEDKGYIVYLNDYIGDNTRLFVTEDIGRDDILKRYIFLAEEYEERKKQYNIY